MVNIGKNLLNLFLQIFSGVTYRIFASVKVFFFGRHSGDAEPSKPTLESPYSSDPNTNRNVDITNEAAAHGARILEGLRRQPLRFATLTRRGTVLCSAVHSGGAHGRAPRTPRVRLLRPQRPKLYKRSFAFGDTLGIHLLMNPNTPWYLNPIFLTPIVGFIGVIIGEGMATVRSHFTEKKQFERDQAQHKRDHQIEQKRAARLLEMDLIDAIATIQMSISLGTWWSEDLGYFSISSWSSCRPILACELPRDAWKEVSLALASTNDIRAIHNLSKGQKLTDTDKDFLNERLPGITAARDALSAFAD